MNPTGILAGFRGVAPGESPGDAATSEGAMMANPVPAGSDVSAGSYQCTNHGDGLGDEADGYTDQPPAREGRLSDGCRDETEDVVRRDPVWLGRLLLF